MSFAAAKVTADIHTADIASVSQYLDAAKATARQAHVKPSAPLGNVADDLQITRHQFLETSAAMPVRNKIEVLRKAGYKTISSSLIILMIMTIYLHCNGDDPCWRSLPK